MDELQVTFMEGIENGNPTNRKRALAEDKSKTSDKRNSVEQSVKIVNNELTLKINLINQGDNFIDINWINACEFINNITNDWIFLAFGSNHRNVLINATDIESAKKIQNILEINVDEKYYPVSVCQVTASPRRGIIFHKFLSASSDEQIEQSLKVQGVSQFFRIQKIDSISKEKWYTGSIILNFDTDIPSHIFVSKIRIPVNQLAPRPMICFHCGILGHTRERCTKKSINFCTECYFEHAKNVDCINRCKQCQGAHISNDENCLVLIREFQILKIKDSHGLNYFDAKSIHESINPVLIADPLDGARLKIQELIQRNNILFSAGRQQMLDKNELMKKIESKDKEIESLNEVIFEQRKNHAVELNEIHETMKQHQARNEAHAAECAKDFEKMQSVLKNLEALEVKYNSAQLSIGKLQKDKASDAKHVEEFVNSSDSIAKAFTVFVDKKKLAQNSMCAEIKTKFVKSRSNSLEKIEKVSFP